MKYANNVTELIGNTPLVRLAAISDESGALVLGKCEFMNPSGSVKDRIAYAMLKNAMDKKLIDHDTVIIEPTSGNTGVGLAAITAAMGMRLILTMPSSMSIERRKLLAALGAQLVLTPPELGMKGAIERANELAKETPNSYIPQQFDNPANPEMHRRTTAQEILRDTDGKVDIFVASVGTGGTLTGVAEEIKRHNPHALIIAVEPDASPVLGGGKPAPHKIQGIGAGFVPKVLNTQIYDEVLPVSYEDAAATARALAKHEGILVGISSGANAYAAKIVASRPENHGKTVVTILCDTGERYLSTTLFEE